MYRPTAYATPPEGLEKCEVCGEYKGVVHNHRTLYGIISVEVNCLCDGVLCKNCNKNRVHRPISNYFDPKDGRIWHVPHFSQCVCAVCRPILEEEKKRYRKRSRMRTVASVKKLCRKLRVNLVGIYQYADEWPRTVFVLEADRGNEPCFVGYEREKWKFGRHTIEAFTELRQIFPKYIAPREKWITCEEWINEDGGGK